LIRYCSSNCYANHDVRCTEAFAKRSVEEHLRTTQATRRDTRKIEEALKRVYETDNDNSVVHHQFDNTRDSDDDSDYDFAFNDNDEAGEEEAHLFQQLKLLDDVSVVDDKVLENSVDGNTERKERRLAAAVKALAKNSPAARAAVEAAALPWWRRQCARDANVGTGGQALVREVVGIEEKHQEQSFLPQLPREALPPFSSMCPTSPPPPSLRCIAASLLCGYCYTWRMYGGDWDADAASASEVCMEVAAGLSPPPKGKKQNSKAPTLTASSVFLTTASAATNASETVVESQRRDGASLSAAAATARLIIGDAAMVARSGRAASVRALEDLRRMLKSGSKASKSKALRVAAKKALFYASWANEHSDMLAMLAAELEVWLEEASRLKVDDGREVLFKHPSSAGELDAAELTGRGQITLL